MTPTRRRSGSGASTTGSSGAGSRRRPSAPRAAGLLANTLWISLDKWESFVLQKTALCRNGIQIASRLLDTPPEEMTVGLRFFFKPAGGEAGAVAPGRGASGPRLDHHSVNMWVPLDGSTEENGCLCYIPGSHPGRDRVHRHPGHGAPEVALMTDDVRAVRRGSGPAAGGRRVLPLLPHAARVGREHDGRPPPRARHGLQRPAPTSRGPRGAALVDRRPRVPDQSSERRRNVLSGCAGDET